MELSEKLGKVETLPTNAGGLGSIPGRGVRIPDASWPENQNIKQKQCCYKFNKGFKSSPHQKKKKIHTRSLYSLRIVCVHAQSLQSCLTQCIPMDCSPPGSSVPGIFQARILEWVAMPSSRDRPDPGMEPASPVTPALQAVSWLAETPGKPNRNLG